MTLCEEATELLQALVRIDTVNPPGNETVAAEALRAYLAGNGIESELLAQTPERANLENAATASVHAYPRGDSPSGVRQMIGNAWE